MQSEYREGHSTETALVKIHHDILQAIDNQQCVLLVLLDLSAAFDTVDHEILIQRLQNRIDYRKSLRLAVILSVV